MSVVIPFVMWFVFSGLIFVLLKRENKMTNDAIFGFSFMMGLFGSILFMVVCLSLGVIQS